MTYFAKLTGKDLSRYLSAAKCLAFMQLAYIGMKKLRHCQLMYRPINISPAVDVTSSGKSHVTRV